MPKKISVLLAILLVMLCASSCTKEMKKLTCDGCGKEVEVEKSSNMEEEWIILCEDCQPEIEFEDPFAE